MIRKFTGMIRLLCLVGCVTTVLSGGSAPRPLTSTPGWEGAPELSPDGRRVAFHWTGEKQDNWDVYIQPVDGKASERLRLTDSPEFDGNPVWSPDGSRIAFVQVKGEKSTIYTVSAAGGTPVKLVDVEGTPLILGMFLNAPAWSADGTTLAFGEKPDESTPSRIALYDLKTGEKRLLSAAPEGFFGDSWPTFSPDGKSVAFVRMKNFGVNDLYVQDLDSKEARRLTEEAFDGCWKPTWMGKEIFFTVADSSGSSSLMRVPAAGGKTQTLDGLGELPQGSSVRPGRIVYVSAHNPGGTNIWRLDLDRGDPAKKVGEPSVFIASEQTDGNLDTSPDGNKLVFASERSGLSSIWLSDANGGNPKELARPGSYSGTPRWSPDGKWIACDALEGEDRGIYLIEASSGEVSKLTGNPADDGRPEWSRDGKSIYFSSTRTGELQLWKKPVDGGEAVQVTQKGGRYAMESKDGKTLYFSREEQGPIYRRPVSGGSAEMVLDRPVHWGGWTLTDSGIYFMTVAESPARNDWKIEFLNFSSGDVTTVASESGRQYYAWLEISADETALFYSRGDWWSADLAVVDGFE